MTDQSQSRSDEPLLITEDALFFYIHDSPASVRVQRKQVLRNTDKPMSSDEETILMLCRAHLAPRSERGDTSDVVNRLEEKIARHVDVRGSQPIGIEEQLLRDARDALRYVGHARMEQDSRACPYLQCSIQGCNKANCVNK